jgi:hypothetical protein
MFYSNAKMSDEDEEKLRKIIICYENNLLKEVNLEIYQKFAP